MAGRLSDTEQTEIINLYDAGMRSPKEIAKQLGRGNQAVREYLAATGRIPHHKPRIDDSLMDAVVAGYTQGLSLRECAEKHCMSKGTVRAVILFRGVPMQPSGAPRHKAAHEAGS